MMIIADWPAAYQGICPQNAVISPDLFSDRDA
jgi:hypothetical protein